METLKIFLLIFWGAVILIFAMIAIAIFTAILRTVSKIKFQISSLFKAKKVEISGKIIFLGSKEVEYSIPSLSSEYSFDLYSSMTMRGKEFFALVKNNSGEIISVILPNEKFYKEALIKKANKESVRWLCTKFLWFLLVKEEKPISAEASFVT